MDGEAGEVLGVGADGDAGVTPQRFARLAPLLVAFASLEVLTQVVTAAAGLLVVRVLPVAEFAVYAIAVSVQASLAVLSDIGISTLLLSRAGHHSNDELRLAKILTAARALRFRLFAVVSLAAAPLLWWSLSATKPSLAAWAVILGLVLATVALQVSATVDGTMALALLRSVRYQGALLSGSLVRLVGVLVVLRRVPTSWAGLIINLCGTAAQALYLRSFIRRLLPGEVDADPEDTLAFRGGVRSQLINAAYYAFSSQITLWLVGLLANSRTVAEVGALGRISSILVLAQGGVLALVAPRIARYGDRRLLLRRYVQVLSLAFGACTSVFVLSVIYPQVFLWLIGPKYSGLESLLPLAMGGTLLYALAVTVYSLNAARGWIEEAWVGVPLTLVLQAASLLVLDVSRIRDALLFGFSSSLPPLVVHSWIAVRRMRREFSRGSFSSVSS